jgi:hypothetical protein
VLTLRSEAEATVTVVGRGGTTETSRAGSRLPTGAAATELGQVRFSTGLIRSLCPISTPEAAPAAAFQFTMDKSLMGTVIMKRPPPPGTPAAMAAVTG